MNCRRAQKAIEKWGGDPVEIRTHHQEAWKHIESCDACQAELVRYEKLHALLKEGRLLEPKSDFWKVYQQEVHQRIRLANRRKQQEPKPRCSMLPNFLPKPAFVAVILLLVLSVGLLVGIWQLPFKHQETETFYTDTPDFYLSAYQQMAQQNPLSTELDNPLVWTVEDISLGEQQ